MSGRRLSETCPELIFPRNAAMRMPARDLAASQVWWGRHCGRIDVPSKTWVHISVFLPCEFVLSLKHFQQPPYRVWSAFFHDLAVFTSRHSCKSLSFLVTSLNIQLEDSEKLHFSAKEKKLWLWADVSVLYGDLKQALFVILDQSKRAFYLPHLIMTFKVKELGLSVNASEIGKYKKRAVLDLSKVFLYCWWV